MGQPTANTGFVGNHVASGDSPDDPNVFTLAEMQAAMGTDSTAISLITSGVTSTAASGALNSVPVSTADSKGVSGGSRASVADSKAVSNSANISVADSKALSVSGSTSMADSKAVSVATATPTLTIVAASQAVSTADSKAVSAATAFGLLNIVDVKSYPYTAVGDGVTDDSATIQAAIDTVRVAGGGKVFLPPGIYGIGTTLKIGDAGVTADGVTLETSRLAHATAGAIFKWIGATGGDNAILSIRNAHMGAIKGIGFDAANKADYCVQVRHVTGDVNVTEHWDYYQCMFTAARKYNVLVGEVDTTALSNGDASQQNFHNCYFRRDATGSAATTAHVRVRSANTLPVNFWGCQTDHSTNPTYGLSTDGGFVNFYGHVSVGTDNVDIFMSTQAAQVPPNISVYGWESQSTNFMRADVTGGGTMQRSTILSGVKHSRIAGTAGDAIQWNQNGGHGGLVLIACRFDKPVNIQNANARVWSHGTIFSDSTQTFSTNPQVVEGSWGTNVGPNHQIAVGRVMIAQSNSINVLDPPIITVPNNGVIALGLDTMSGYLVITDSEGGMARYAIRSTNHLTTEKDDEFGFYTVAAGTASSTNIYWSAGNNRYELENKRGGSRDYRMTLTGSRG